MKLCKGRGTAVFLLLHKAVQMRGTVSPYFSSRLHIGSFAYIEDFKICLEGTPMVVCG